ncbi:MAG: Fe(2+) transporter permease subunit FeoB [gamma proteobacterium symbiont of Bathyaustriella thionipta]|nr:Fe(2+) transporter permease subunit FeoB [gamma proteobacterium symbiont of Bathyaustriella thionipta]
MGCCAQDEAGIKVTQGKLKLALAGNPNCGKTALFNALTGVRQKTGNWPGVTVDRKEGRFRLGKENAIVVDLPGTYSLDGHSPDEEVTRQYLLSHDADLIINVVDASNLERNLYFSVQLLEMGVPLILVLNMMDVAQKQGYDIDIERLSEELGCQVVAVVATRKEGLDQLKAAVQAVVAGEHSHGYRLAHDECVEDAIAEIRPHIQSDVEAASAHWLALKMLEGDEQAFAMSDANARKIVTERRLSIQDRVDEDLDIYIADSRYGHAHALTQSVLKQRGKMGKNLSDRIDRLVLDRILGIPIFLLVMYLMFMFTINFGGAFVDFFDGVGGAIFVDGLKVLIADWMPAFLTVLLADGVGGGLQVVATFVPIIGTLYIFLSILEDSGYMARAAFVMDRFMRSIGLPGKAFVPLIVGFGCNVPAVMATRTLENERERKLTMLMNPFMSCGARLPVYALFVAAFFPSNGQNIVFALYLIGISVAILTGMVMKRTMLKGKSDGFLMELPSYHRPTLKGVLLRTWDRLKVFVREAGVVIVAMVTVINLLNSIGTDGSFGNEDSENSVLSEISKQLTPAFAPMGLKQENWPATVGILSGVLAKEVVVGTLDTLYSQLARQENGIEENEAAFQFWPAISAAAATIPENLAGLQSSVSDPLNLDVGDISNRSAAADTQEVAEDTFSAMAARFDGQAGAFAYLLFVLLYFPCVATIGAIKREAGFAWAGFVAFWTTLLAYSTATLFYQSATYSQHPAYSASVIAITVAVLIAVVLLLRRWGRQNTPIGVPAQDVSS